MLENAAVVLYSTTVFLTVFLTFIKLIPEGER